MNDDRFLKNMSKTQKTGFNYGYNTKSSTNFQSIDPNNFSTTFADDLMNNSGNQDDTRDNLNQSYREPNSYRTNDDSIVQSEWDNADV